MGIINRLLVFLGIQYLRSTHKYAFIILNVLSLIGVLFLNWNVGELILIFVSEVVIIHIFNAMRIMRLTLKPPDSASGLRSPTKAERVIDIILTSGVLFWITLFYGGLLFFAMGISFTLENFGGSDRSDGFVEQSLKMLTHEGVIVLFIIHAYLFFKYPEIPKFPGLLKFLVISFLKYWAMAFILLILMAISMAIHTAIIFVIVMVLFKMGIDMYEFKYQNKKLAPTKI